MRLQQGLGLEALDVWVLVELGGHGILSIVIDGDVSTTDFNEQGLNKIWARLKLARLGQGWSHLRGEA